MIPLLVLFFGENQHLYQAAAMICNVFVALSSLIAHIKQKTNIKSILKWMIPASLIGVFFGVRTSNLPLFSGEKSYILARLFGIYLVYVIGYNLFKIYRSKLAPPKTAPKDILRGYSPTLSGLTGMITGLCAGLLGIGAGTVSTSTQQLTMKVPLRRAMSNSAANIAVMAVLGAAYKNATLARHGIPVTESLKIAALAVPAAIVGGYIGGRLMHALPKEAVRAAFIVILILAAVKMLTVTP